MSKRAIDVVAVEMKSMRVLWVYQTDDNNAESVINTAIMRQGVEDRYFVRCAPGRWRADDIYSTTAPDPQPIPTNPDAEASSDE